MHWRLQGDPQEVWACHSENVWQVVGRMAEQLRGPSWATLNPNFVIEKLRGQDSWNMFTNSVQDFALFKIDSLYCSGPCYAYARLADSPLVMSPLPVKPPRRRLQAKQVRQPAFFGGDDPVNPVEASVRVRNIYWRRLPPSNPPLANFNVLFRGAVAGLPLKWGCLIIFVNRDRSGKRVDQTCAFARSRGCCVCLL